MSFSTPQYNVMQRRTANHQVLYTEEYSQHLAVLFPCVCTFAIDLYHNNPARFAISKTFETPVMK